MSTTRKIKGALAAGAASKLVRDGAASEVGFVNFYIADAKDSYTAATLIIGKGYTVEEVRALIQDLYNAAMDGPYMPNYARMDECLAKNNITL